jgi:sulfonate transport system substrate-binding protein
MKVFVQAAQWLATQPPQQVFQLWTKSGTTFSSFREDWAGEDVKYRSSPLIDPYLGERYKLQIKEAKRLNLIRETFTWESWIEPKYLDGALKELGLENFWLPRGSDGKPIRSDVKSAGATPAAAPSGTAQSAPGAGAAAPAATAVPAQAKVPSATSGL